jgi:hypothetical protein
VHVGPDHCLDLLLADARAQLRHDVLEDMSRHRHRRTRLEPERPTPVGPADYRTDARFGDYVVPSHMTVGWWYGTPRYEPFFEAVVTRYELGP